MGRLLGALVIALAAAQVPVARIDPEQVLAERFSFTSDEIARARGGQAVARLIAGAEPDQLAVAGAVRLDGDKKRLAAWVQNIAHFRGSAELGVAHLVDSPPTPASFAAVTADPADPEADTRLRSLLLQHAKTYLQGGDAALGHGFGALLKSATNLVHLAPAFADYLQRFPAATLAGTEQRLYWSTMATEKGQIVSLHHLVTYRPAGGDVLIADKTIYASRFFDAGALVIALQDTVDAKGYYLIAASRVRSSELNGVAASVLRRQIQRAAVDTVEMYLGWIRESLAVPPAR